MESLETVILSVSIFGSAVLIIYIVARYNYLIKKTYAERGIEIRGNKIRYNEIACIVIGIAIGLGLSSVFTVMILPEETMELLIYATILLGGGAGLFAAHNSRRRVERD